MIPALILAAGASSRMGRPKALLPTERAGECFVVRLARTLWSAGACDVVVVTGRDSGDVQAALEAAGVAARVAVNPAPERGQLSSLLVGLDVVDRPGVSGALAIPVDQPLVKVETVRAVIELYRSTNAPFVRPMQRGRSGHPVLFDRRLFGELRRAELSHGARVVVRAHASEGRTLDVDDAGAFADIDTPEDYERVFGARLPDQP